MTRYTRGVLRHLLAALFVTGATAAATVATAQEPTSLREALGDTVTEGWIYEDLAAGYAAARKTGKPLLVAFRCVP